MIDTSDVDVFLGLDVGKGEHHGTAVTRSGKRVFDKRLPNSEPKLRAVLDKLIAKTAPSWSSSTSPPASAPCPWRSHGTPAAVSPTCPV
ncbi:hypothetical protein KCMC57_up00420 [Kitasatospora sp. CMC57]|uniref:Transposase IS110-like N-terminal domain-containing protein n=1 Tax=Kitasatospora sp. CMC57 TaxID=3231513 RepID=A0AB33JV91_9ACTN